MKAIGIASDSTCDLSEELKERYGITVLPLCIHLEEEVYHDGVDITLDELFAWSDAHRLTPKTAAFSPAEAEAFLKERMEECEELIFFTISAPMSSCNNVMKIVAEELGYEKRVHVIDSANLSTGLGQLAIEAAIMAEKGASVSEIIEEIERLKPLVRVRFVIDTMNYLHRGGRCSGMTALVAGSLKLHPCIEVVDGAMRVGKKYRGKMDKVNRSFFEDYREDYLKGRPARIFISHANCDDATIHSIKSQLQALEYYDEVLVTSVGGVVASHCGPGTLGIVYVEKG